LAEFIRKTSMIDEGLKNIFSNLEDKLLQAGYGISALREIDYGIQFNIKKGTWNEVLRIYKNKKGLVRYDFSQIRDPEKREDITGIVTDDIGIEKYGSKIKKEVIIDNFPVLPIIGTDESGKGDYFGPLVTAGVYMDERTKSILEKSGVRDSKKIADSKIFDLAKVIKSVCQGQYVVIEISPETYNNLYTSFKAENKNLNVLLAWAHAKAIEELLQKVECENVLSDKFADEKFIISKLQEKGKKVNLRQEHKAESNTAVAAASILARERFLEKLKKISTEYKTNFSKGVSSSVISQAKDLLANYGIATLKKVAKMHFKTTEEVIN
jgi:ribonuclease HIII